MNRPPEYANLIKTNAFAEVQANPDACAALIKNARDYHDMVKLLPEEKTLQRFTLAYEGFFQIVQAVLEFYGVRTKDAGRNTAILRVAADLAFESGEIAAVARAHDRRNNTSYRSPFPPMSRAEADAMISLLSKAIQGAERLVQSSGP
ncbi:MAG TPA: hypothetical protein VGE55_00735 [Limnobacter sp.]|uniref:hypothetical protein n=1 Tax=Limnobacter sp. TaxID=2003368 RepID=UPI002ED91ECC